METVPPTQSAENVRVILVSLDQIAVTVMPQYFAMTMENVPSTVLVTVILIGDNCTAQNVRLAFYLSHLV
jgi:hypothetical protein